MAVRIDPPRDDEQRLDIEETLLNVCDLCTSRECSDCQIEDVRQGLQAP